MHGLLQPFGVVRERTRTCYFAQEDEADLYNEVHNNIGLELIAEENKFTLTWRQRMMEESLGIATIETVKMHGTFSPPALCWDIDDQQRTLTLTFDHRLTEGNVRYENGMVDLMMSGVRNLSLGYLCTVSSMDPDDRIPDGELTMIHGDEWEGANIEFTVVSSNNKDRQLQVKHDARTSIKLHRMDSKEMERRMDGFPQGLY